MQAVKKHFNHQGKLVPLIDEDGAFYATLDPLYISDLILSSQQKAIR